ncbi:MAG TPA: CorA family divalent cation transporter [Candidatus Paceibacterota bacterium]|nr:CorA family divalent cation transporter [Candidatus Paceibacterota bacterium]
MVTRHACGKVTWVDLEAPTFDELSEVMREFNIDPRVEEEITTPTPYPLTLAASDCLYLILHFPTTDPSGGTRDQEVDFIVGKDFLITARYEVIDSILTLHRVFEAEGLIGSSKHVRADTVLEQILQRLYGAIREEMERVASNLDRIERDIFSGRERQTVRAISEVARVLLRFETVLARHEEPLDAFLAHAASSDFFGKSFGDSAARIRAEHDHVAALVSSYRAVARELRITNDSLLTSSQNEVMKTLTMMAFILAPASVLAGLFGMNMPNIPLAQHPYGFWIVVCLFFAISGGFYLVFKLKKWL